MFWSKTKSQMPSPENALPGRPTPIEVPDGHLVLDATLKGPFPEGTQLATFGMGCFWGAEKLFWNLPGVVSTAVGYAGGYTPNPTYEEVCSGRTGHAEVVQVAFDPSRITYAQLLKVFWENHDPTEGMRQGNDVGTQYRSPIYSTAAEQAREARAVADDVPGGLEQGRAGDDHDADRAGRRVLLRRGLPPAVPDPGAQRLLPEPCDRGQLSRSASESRPRPDPRRFKWAVGAPMAHSGAG